MKYIITATKSEAQAFVDKFKLSKEKSNSEITLIVSGIGVENMFKKTSQIVTLMDKTDTLLNIGICGASSKFEIGELLNIDINTKSVGKYNLTCCENEVYQKDKYDIVDMESSGFIEASNQVENRYIFKVVSDNFAPETVTKEKTKKLIYDKIDEIMQKVSQ